MRLPHAMLPCVLCLGFLSACGDSDDPATRDQGPAGADSAFIDSATDKTDAQVTFPDAGGFFPCGEDDLFCYKGSNEYCKAQAPGVCGGDPVPDGGMCPPNCTPTTCPGGQSVCLCTTFECVAAPAGCTDCACLSLPAGCTCTIQYGSPLVECSGA